MAALFYKYFKAIVGLTALGYLYLAVYAAVHRAVPVVPFLELPVDYRGLIIAALVCTGTVIWAGVRLKPAQVYRKAEEAEIAIPVMFYIAHLILCLYAFVADFGGPVILILLSFPLVFIIRRIAFSIVNGVELFILVLTAAGERGFMIPPLILSSAAVTAFGVLIDMLLRSMVKSEGLLEKTYASVTQLSLANMRLQEANMKNEHITLSRERRRIARELHDTVGYSLTSILMQLNYATELYKKTPEAVGSALTGLESMTREAVQKVRDEVAKIRDIDAEETDWIKDIIRLCETFEDSTGMRIKTRIRIDASVVSKRIGETLFRIVQEAINNACIHGYATYVDISGSIDDDSGCVLLRVSDNGIGAKKLKASYGLMGMRERAEQLGGEVKWVTQEGKGFDLGVDIPLD